MERMTGGRFEYNMKFHMATCTGDTPMRAKIACTYNQTGHRGDQYNYWSGCSVDRHKKRHLGYAKPQEQPAKSSMLGNNIKLGAVDKLVYRGGCMGSVHGRGNVHPRKGSRVTQARGSRSVGGKESWKVLYATICTIAIVRSLLGLCAPGRARSCVGCREDILVIDYR